MAQPEKNGSQHAGPADQRLTSAPDRHRKQPPIGPQVPALSYGVDAMTRFDRLPFTKISERAGHQSSFDRTGGNNDFGHVLSVDPNGEKVLLDLPGPGCVYRMWFTAYTPSAAFRVYFDDEPAPRIDLPMGEPGSAATLFGGQVAPFEPPLVANALVASGGAYCYVPLPFQRSIRVTTTDPSTSFYYNIDYHLFDPDAVISTWTGNEDLSSARALWSNVGDDPKSPAGATVESGSTTIPAGGAADLLDLAGPGQISAIRLAIPGVVPGPSRNPVTDNGRAHRGSSQCTVAVDPANQGVILTRRLDYGVADQQASVSVDGVRIGTWFTPGSDTVDHWRDSGFALPASATSGKTSITVRIDFVGSTVDWNEFGYSVASTVNGTDVQTDRLDVGDLDDESAHRYAIDAQTWAGTRSFTYPPDLAPTDNGRAHRGSSQFTVAVDPANQGVVLRRRLDYAVPGQQAAVYVDGQAVGEWSTPGADSAFPWRDYGFAIPAEFTAGKSAVAVELAASSQGTDWTEYRYWIYSKVDATRAMTDQIDIGNAASEAAHRYAITGETGIFTRSYRYPPQLHYQDILNNVSLQLFWDDEPKPSVHAPLGLLFGMGWFGVAESRGLGAGIGDDGVMYLYFPMPFAGRARMRVVNGSAVSVDLCHQVSHQPFTESFAGVGYFKTAFHSQLPTTVGKDVLLLETAGAGQVVGVGQSDLGVPSRWYLEGDERALVDGSRSPALHGTGTEDFYNGAFYFENGLYTQPVSGNTAHLHDTASDSTAMYRELISDAVPFRKSLRLTIEHGGTDDTSTNVWSLVHYYLEPAARMKLSDTLVVGDAASERQHAYSINRQRWWGSRTFTFDGENNTIAVTASGRAHTGTSEFTMSISPANGGVTLRRLFDQGVFSQRATVSVDGASVGTWFVAGGNGSHRWREEDFAVPARYTSGKSAIRVQIQFVASTIDWNEFQYQAFALLP